MGKVYLVGAGSGDEGLLTIKGMERLKECDAVVYDRLASERLLDYVPKGCERIYVGKQPGKHYRKQDEINEILVDCAKRHKLVVRLKGGDPFVFGRGGEEVEILQKHGIPFEVIPGISSAIAVPECAGIPVTHRRVSRSFHVITGHTEEPLDEESYHYKALAEMEGTLVFLMGLSRLGKIAEKLIASGKAETTPAAVIANGTTDYQCVVRGTLASIEEEVKKSKISSPAVIVIGETAAYQYKDNIRKKRIGVTATEALLKKLKTGLEKENMDVVPVCNMEIKKTEQIEKLRQELSRIEEYQWILFTSQNAVAIFFEEMQDLEIDIRRLGRIKFGVLGSGTSAKLKEYGILADFIPSAYQVSVMAREFSRVAEKGEKVLIPRAVQGSVELENVLKECGIVFCNLPVYDVTGKIACHKAALEEVDYLVFVSASGVQSFFAEIKREGIVLPEGIKIACIGTVTCQKVKQLYGEADVVADVSDVNGLMDAIISFEKMTEKW